MIRSLEIAKERGAMARTLGAGRSTNPFHVNKAAGFVRAWNAWDEGWGQTDLTTCAGEVYHTDVNTPCARAGCGVLHEQECPYEMQNLHSRTRRAPGSFR